MAAHFVHGLRDQSYHMEPVKDNIGRRQPVSSGGDVGVPHIHRHPLHQTALFFLKLTIIRLQTVLRRVIHYKFYLTTLQITDQSLALVPFRKGLLINTEIGWYPTHFSFKPWSHRAFQGSPHFLPAGMQQSTDLGDVAFLQGFDHLVLKGQGKPRPWFRPGSRHQLDPVDRTANPRHPGMEQRLALTGIQVSPDPLLVVVMQGTCLSTSRAFPLNPLISVTQPSTRFLGESNSTLPTRQVCRIPSRAAYDSLSSSMMTS